MTLLHHTKFKREKKMEEEKKYCSQSERASIQCVRLYEEIEREREGE